MFRVHIYILFVSSACVLAAGLLPTTPAALAHEDDTDMDIRDFVLHSQFIFKGRVESIEYRNSEAVAVIDPTTGLPVSEDGAPVFEDGSDLPHSFVTFSVERIYKGKLPPGGPVVIAQQQHLTLRFVGGPFPHDSEEILFVDTYPFFDVGDRSILFVERNEVKACPLYRSGYGRLWILPRSNQPTRNFIYNNYGQELVLAPGTANSTQARDEVAFGPYHPFPEILVNTIGDFVLEKVVVDPENEYSLPDVEPDPQPPIAKGPHFEESQFDAFLDAIVTEVHTPSELAALPPINSADPDLPFVVEAFGEDEPGDSEQEPTAEEPRPWLEELDPERREAILEAERVEAQLFELSGGDPVLPETPCEMRLLTEGPIRGDISGPQGRPDCYVDFFDFVALSETWLECNHPDDPACPGPTE